MLPIVSLFVAGLVLLFAGGHALVRGSSRLAQLLGISPIIIGLTVVAFGTSMPEFIVSLLAAIRGRTDVALGNIVGSNISNIGLILGLSALARPIAVNLKLLKFEVPLVIVVSAYFWLICLNGDLGRVDGLTLSLGFVVYLWIVIAGARKNSSVLAKKYATPRDKKKDFLVNLLWVVVGITGLSFGADWTITSAVEISRQFGVSELLLGLTAVAIGTSLPELATSLVAALKNEGDISIGNIIGSNIFNMMAIAGPSALAHPLPVSASLSHMYLPVMLGLTLGLYPLIRTGRYLSRIEGGILVVAYLSIMAWWTW
ncbi:MAG: sodium:calcium antiporter [Calditrichaeota bacterium]|nr:MAG: sodium:calcium antiporter [Calditrichota bacterium]